jgi:hypothetical protein
MSYSHAYDLNCDRRGEQHERAHARRQRRRSDARSRGNIRAAAHHASPPAMCFGLFIATGYLFLGHQQVFPALLGSSIFLTVRAVLPVPSVIY